MPTNSAHNSASHSALNALASSKPNMRTGQNVQANGETGQEQGRYIVVEGPIGVGKTSLARRLAKHLESDLLLELPEENPFLEKFYHNPKQAALPTQLFFLFQRTKQIQNMRQSDLFSPTRVADFLLEKDRLFAQLTLDDDELRLYEQVYQNLTVDSPKPDLVIYLQAPVNVLRNRISQRGVGYEQGMAADYLQKLSDAYTRFFHFYDSAPLLIVNASEIDYVNNHDDFLALTNMALQIESGRHYFNPLRANT